MTAEIFELLFYSCGIAITSPFHRMFPSWARPWVTRSEVAHATSKPPFGPFTFRVCAHNPTVHKFGSKYYLYYMGNTGDGDDTPTLNGQLNRTHRNNQRIGVAVADSPNGPWKRFDKPIIDASGNQCLSAGL